MIKPKIRNIDMVLQMMFRQQNLRESVYNIDGDSPLHEISRLNDGSVGVKLFHSPIDKKEVPVLTDCTI